eukprot:scaffold1778_cov246-Pinguiococcus_pyrenoidosus.AAC.3
MGKGHPVRQVEASELLLIEEAVHPLLDVSDGLERAPIEARQRRSHAAFLRCLHLLRRLRSEDVDELIREVMTRRAAADLGPARPRSRIDPERLGEKLDLMPEGRSPERRAIAVEHTKSSRAVDILVCIQEGVHEATVRGEHQATVQAGREHPVEIPLFAEGDDKHRAVQKLDAQAVDGVVDQAEASLERRGDRRKGHGIQGIHVVLARPREVRIQLEQLQEHFVRDLPGHQPADPVAELRRGVQELDDSHGDEAHADHRLRGDDRRQSFQARTPRVARIVEGPRKLVACGAGVGQAPFAQNDEAAARSQDPHELGVSQREGHDMLTQLILGVDLVLEKDAVVRVANELWPVLLHVAQRRCVPTKLMTCALVADVLQQVRHAALHDFRAALHEARGKSDERILLRLSVTWAAAPRIPGEVVSAVAAASGLGMIKVHLVAFVIRLDEAAVAQDACLVRLTLLADPDDVVSLEGILAHPSLTEAPDGLEALRN